MVQVHYGEGVANHTGPESCGCGREAAREALTGVRAGQVWSGESNVVRGADAVVGEHQKPWGSSGCGSERGGLTIVGGHGWIPGGEQVVQRAVEGAGSGLQEPMSAFL